MYVVTVWTVFIYARIERNCVLLLIWYELLCSINITGFLNQLNDYRRLIKGNVKNGAKLMVEF